MLHAGLHHASAQPTGAQSSEHGAGAAVLAPTTLTPTVVASVVEVFNVDTGDVVLAAVAAVAIVSVPGCSGCSGCCLVDVAVVVKIAVVAVVVVGVVVVVVAVVIVLVAVVADVVATAASASTLHKVPPFFALLNATVVPVLLPSSHMSTTVFCTSLTLAIEAPCHAFKLFHCASTRSPFAHGPAVMQKS